MEEIKKIVEDFLTGDYGKRLVFYLECCWLRNELEKKEKQSTRMFISNNNTDRMNACIQ